MSKKPKPKTAEIQKKKAEKMLETMVKAIMKVAKEQVSYPFPDMQKST